MNEFKKNNISLWRYWELSRLCKWLAWTYFYWAYLSVTWAEIPHKPLRLQLPCPCLISRSTHRMEFNGRRYLLTSLQVYLWNHFLFPVGWHVFRQQSPLMVLPKVNKQLVSDPPAGSHFWTALEQSLTYTLARAPTHPPPPQAQSLLIY